MRIWPVALLASAALLAGCTSSSGGDAASSAPSDEGRAVVLVSGVASVTPFTTPDAACTSGFSAGNTWGPMRDYLTAEGLRVFTAPAMDFPGQPVPSTLDDTVRGPFGGCPEQPPLDLTISSINDPQGNGERLAAFINWLNTEYGVTSIDMVTHSLGGIVGRNGLRYLKEGDSPVAVRSLTTLSSPWEPVMLANPPYDPETACDGLPICVGIVNSLIAVPELAIVVQSFQPKLFNAWTELQTGVLDGVPVTLVSGGMFTKPGGDPDKWPNDGFVQYSAALARTVPDSVLPQRACFAFPFSHSGSTSVLAGASPEESVTFSPAVASVVANAIRTAGTPEQLPNRLGCPTP